MSGAAQGKAGKEERAGKQTRVREASARTAAAVHRIHEEAARLESSLPNGVFLVSSSIGARVDLVSPKRNRFSVLCSLSSLISMPRHQIAELSSIIKRDRNYHQYPLGLPLSK